MNGESPRTKLLGMFGRDNPYAAYRQVITSLYAAEKLIPQIDLSLRVRFKELGKKRNMQDVRILLEKAYNATVAEINAEGSVATAINSLIRLAEEAYEEAANAKNPRNPDSIAKLQQVAQKLPKIMEVVGRLLALAKKE